MLNSILNYNLSELEEILTSLGEKKFRAKQIFDGVLKNKSFNEISNLPLELKKKLNESFLANPVKISKVVESKDGTKKLIYSLPDGNIIEGVLMQYKYGHTLCVSTQVGCRMGCKFCASGLNGLVRNLCAAEILGQIIAAENLTDNEKETKQGKSLGEINLNNRRKIVNVVLMGSGEPLDNYDEVTKFLHLASSQLNISQRNISLSTCGIVPKIDKLADDGFSITLTISLHAPSQQLRESIMPIAKVYDILEVINAAKRYFDKTGRRVIFEYALIKDLNDSFDCAEKLASLVKGFPSHINIIPLNEVKERGLSGTSKKQVFAFKDKLEKLGVSASVRRTMGEDIEGACGQLRNKILKGNE